MTDLEELLFSSPTKLFGDEPTEKDYPNDGKTLYRLLDGSGTWAETECYVETYVVYKTNPASYYIILTGMQHLTPEQAGPLLKIQYNNAKARYAHYDIKDAVKAYRARKEKHVLMALRDFRRAVRHMNLARSWRGEDALDINEIVDKWDL